MRAGCFPRPRSPRSSSASCRRRSWSCAPAPSPRRSERVAKPPRFESDFTEATHSTALVYDGGLLKIRRDEVRLPDGHHAWREYAVHPGAVMILAFVDPETVLLERQFRYPKQRHF